MASNKYYAIILLIVVVALNASVCCKAKPYLASGQRLSGGESLRNGDYVLTMQQNCNLVLYQGTSSIWATNTRGTNCHCIMQYDGNFVIYTSTGSVLWSTRTWQSNARRYYIFVLLEDGNMIVYGSSLWGSNTSKTSTMVIPKIIKTNETGSIINMVSSTSV